MKRMKWVLVLCISMLLVCLTACGSGEPAGETQGNGVQQDQKVPSQSEADGGISEADYDAAYQSMPADTVVMTVNGEEIEWQEYYRWLYYIMTHMQETGAVADWDAPCDTDPAYTNAEYAEFYAQSAVTQYHVIAQTAEARNVVLDEEEEAALQRQWEDHAAQFEQEEDLLARLEDVYTDQEQYRFERETALLYEKLFAVRYGEHGEKCSDEAVAAFAEDHAYVRMRYLLLRTVDDDKLLLDETVVEQKKNQIEGFHLQIRDAADPAAEFERLYTAYNEDTMAELYPDGYICSLDTVPNVELRDAIAAMPEYGISEPVRGSYGYYILYRLPLDYDGIAEYDRESEFAYTLRHLAAIELFHTEIAELFARADVVCSEELEALEMHQLFGLQ